MQKHELTDYERIIAENAMIHFAKHCDSVRDEQGPSSEEAARTARVIYTYLVDGSI